MWGDQNVNSKKSPVYCTCSWKVNKLCTVLNLKGNDEGSHKYLEERGGMMKLKEDSIPNI